MTDEWYTPDHILDIAREVLGNIDLDPASCELAQKRVKADKYYTKQDNGLLHNWSGNVWMNPPYSEKLIILFVKRLVQCFEDGDVEQALCIVNNVTETVAVQYLLKHSTVWCFPKGRISFIDQYGKEQENPPKGQLIVYFCKSLDKASRARQILSQLGPTGLCVINMEIDR